MLTPDWTKEFPGMISVCDVHGKILALNDREAEFFKEQGGRSLIGTSLYQCHKPSSNQMIKEMMKDQKTRVYIAEEHGQRELVIQSPWYQDGQFAGLVEISVMLEADIAVIKRG